MNIFDAILLCGLMRLAFIAYEEWTSIYVQIRTENEADKRRSREGY